MSTAALSQSPAAIGRGNAALLPTHRKSDAVLNPSESADSVGENRHGLRRMKRAWFRIAASVEETGEVFREMQNKESSDTGPV